jgi:ABC-type Fe3+-siderophore transport system permease subunit
MEHLPKILIVFSAAITGLFFGYQRQVMADSGEKYPDKIIISVAVATLSYVAGALICIFAKHKYKKLDFIWAAVLGSAFCALFLNVIKYLFDNRRFNQSASVFAYIFGRIGDSAISFLIAFLIYSLLSVFIFGFIYLLSQWLMRILSERS